MSTTIDERIVEMKFKADTFFQGIQKSVQGLDQLKKSLNLDGAKKGLNELDAAGKGFSLAGIANGVDSVVSKFSALSVVGITALATIANQAVNTGLSLVSSLTVDPIKAGLTEYETNLNAIQTILANTQSKGSTLDDVNGALQELNTYSDKTIYNFSEMAKNIGTFTAAGVDLDTSTTAIKGIANLAALSGSNSQQASTAMYQLSQALSTGKVSLMDWNSVVNAGMGGQVFQDALKETARAQGVAVDDIIAKNGSFRDSLQDGWLTSGILTDTLAKFTGDMNAEQLRSMGYTEEQITATMKLAETASDAATKVKTLPQLIGTLQESAGSGWANTWQIIFGDFEEAKYLFTSVNDVLGSMISESAQQRNDVLQGWKDLGGRDVIMGAISNGFTALMNVVKPVKEALTDIFPPVTAQQLYDISVALREFTASLKPNTEQMDMIKRTAKGVFAVLDIGRMIIVQVVGLFGRLFGATTEGAGGLLAFSARVGDFLVKVRDAIKNGEGLTQFFGKLGDVLMMPITLVRALLGFIGQLFSSNISADGIGTAFDGLKERIEPLGGILNFFSLMWDKAGKAVMLAWAFMQPVFMAIGQALGNLGQTIAEGISTGDFSGVLDILNTGLFAVIALAIKKFLDGGLNFNFGGSGMLDSLKGALDGLTGSMEAMQTKLKADALIRIAIAIALITASVVALSLIDSAKLTSALVAMSVMFAQMLGAMAILEKITGVFGAAKMFILAGALIGLAAAMLIFSAAIAVMASMDWLELARGLTGMAVGLGILIGASMLLGKTSVKLVTAAPALLIISAALLLLATALKIFATMSWDDINRALIVLGSSLLILVTAMQSMKSAVFGAISMLIVSAALIVLAGALKLFSTMSWDDIARSMVVLAGSLAILVTALALMSGSVLGAASMVIVALAITILAGALKIVATMSWDDIGRTMVVLAGSLAILAAAMAVMGIPVVLLGAIGMLAAAAAMMMLAPALKLLGTMSWDDIGRGLTVLAAALVIMAAGGVLLLPAIPAFLGLGLAILMIGVGALAAGAGITAFAIGLGLLGAAGAAGAAGLTIALTAVIALIPYALQQFALGIIAFAQVIGTSGPILVVAITTLLMSMITAIGAVLPLIISTLVSLLLQLIAGLTAVIPPLIEFAVLLITTLVNAIVTLVPFLVDAGLRMITGILEGIASNIQGIVEAAISIVTNFIDGVANKIPDIIQSGINLIISFVEGLAQGIDNNAARMREAGLHLAQAIISGMTGGISDGIGEVIGAAQELAQNAVNTVASILQIKSPSRVFRKRIGQQMGAGMALGMTDTLGDIAKASKGMGNTALDSMKETLKNVVDLSADDMDMRPVISPILDLDALRKDSSKIPGLMGDTSISVDKAYAKAAAIGMGDIAPGRQLPSFETQDVKGVEVSLTQINNSPEALRTAEIYRRTNNLMSQVREALNAK